MKKILIICIFLSIGLITNAQNKNLYLVTDIGKSYAIEDYKYFTVKNKYVVSARIGVGFEYKLNNYLSFNSALCFSNDGYRPISSDSLKILDINFYIDNPLLITFKFKKESWFSASSGVINKLHIFNYQYVVDKRNNLYIDSFSYNKFVETYILGFYFGFNYQLSKKIILSTYFTRDLTPNLVFEPITRKNLAIMASFKLKISKN